MAEKRVPAERVRWRGTVSRRDEARPLLVQAGDVALIERGCPRSLVIKCPCGCGEELTVNLDRRVGDAWRLYRRPRGLTVYPSVWREGGCSSHFIIWDDRVLMCDSEPAWEGGSDTELVARVLHAIPAGDLRSFAQVADSLEEAPWDVLRCCRDLVKQGLAHEGQDRLRGWFQRI